MRTAATEYSPDGKVFVTLSISGAPNLWNAASGRRIAFLKGANSQVTYTGFSPDSRHAVTAHQSGDIEVWQTKNGHLEKPFRLSGSVRTAAFSHDGSWLAAAGDGGTAAVWDIARGEKTILRHSDPGIQTLDTQVDPQPLISVHFDGNILRTAGADGSFTNWNWKTGDEVNFFTPDPIAFVNRSFTPDEFRQYVSRLNLGSLSWKPQFVVLHDTGGSDTVGAFPNGLPKKNIWGLESYFRKDMHWNGGPHCIIDQKQIWVLNPLTQTGVLSPSWNNMSWSVMILGNYTTDSFHSVQGAQVRDNAVAAIAALDAAAGLEAGSLRLNSEDPLTKHKNNPGGNIDKADLIAHIRAVLAQHH